MPALFTILAVLFVAMFIIIKITSKNPSTITEEQAASYSKWFRILIPAVLISAVLKYFFF